MVLSAILASSILVFSCGLIKPITVEPDDTGGADFGQRNEQIYNKTTNPFPKYNLINYTFSEPNIYVLIPSIKQQN